MDAEHYLLVSVPIVIALGVYLYRRRAKSRQGYRRVTGGQFQRDIEDGLSSSQFDLNANVADGDTRPGLDADEVRRIMEEEGCSFDQARLIRQQRVLKRNNVDPRTGLPLDPKLVTFS
ncbi:hypothetical protein THASP1DRAFT_27479 [Thamnocephalis sphaerospora]|uniref:Uncharacterized protein n=1 Tax=Thamnocephalis sphaerospora TaxID=78915 RepID=A0A4P9XYE0_9FUNG|nr:hypothetical protein THASP1DRAFT_27479 [Thamnocephalis sphaerospora]|eukprot:RKP10721.1 hypothetical protein THASP1DRAFT_27479 [Thamnocephalis sphaerospora]